MKMEWFNAVKNFLFLNCSPQRHRRFTLGRDPIQPRLSRRAHPPRCWRGEVSACVRVIQAGPGTPR
jgi:hypothetical protein